MYLLSVEVKVEDVYYLIEYDKGVLLNVYNLLVDVLIDWVIVYILLLVEYILYTRDD